MDLTENDQSVTAPGIKTREEEIQEFVDMIKSTFKAVQLEGVLGIRELLLNNVDDDDLVPQVVKTGVVPNLLELMSCEDDLQLQLESAQCVVSICVGGEDDEFAREIVELGGLDISMKLLDSSLEALADHGLWIISSITGINTTYVDQCLEKGCLQKLLEVLERFPTSATIIKDFLWAFCNLTRDKTWNKISPALSESPELVPKIFKLLGNPRPAIRKKALEAIDNVLIENEKQIEIIIQKDTSVRAIIAIANNDTYEAAIRATWVILSMIAYGSPEQIDRLVKYDEILRIFSTILTDSTDSVLLNGVLDAVKRILETGRCDSENKYMKKMKEIKLVSTMKQLLENDDFKDEVGSILEEYFLDSKEK